MAEQLPASPERRNTIYDKYESTGTNPHFSVTVQNRVTRTGEADSLASASMEADCKLAPNVIQLREIRFC